VTEVGLPAVALPEALTAKRDAIPAPAGCTWIVPVTVLPSDDNVGEVRPSTSTSDMLVTLGGLE
jgi:hypothetical protein